MENKRGLIGLVLVILILLIVGFFIFYYYHYNNSPVVGECVNDGDCIKVQTTCCSCSMGGEEKCVNASEASKYQEQLKNCSKEIFCAAVYNCKNLTCGCNGGKCE